MADQRENDDLPPLEEVTPDDGHRVMPQLESAVDESDSWTHLGDEDIGEETEDIGSWYRQIQTRLKAVPSQADKYDTILSAIQLLKELFDDVMEKKSDPAISTSRIKLLFSFDDLCRTLAMRQSSMFKALVTFQQEELEDIQEKVQEIDEVLEREVEEDEDFIERQRRIVSLKETQGVIESCVTDLQALLDAPQPTRQASFVQQQVQQIEQDSVGPKSQVYRESESIHEQATVCLVRCQDLDGQLERRMEELERKQEDKRQEYMSNLHEVEQWLSGVYSLLCQEPIREEVGGAYSQEEEEEENEGEPADAGFVYDSSEDLLPSEDSGSSVGVEPGALETSVDADLSDNDYMDQVVQRVISPIQDDQHEDTDLDDVLATGGPLGHRPSTDLDAVLGEGGVEEVGDEVLATGGVLGQRPSTDLDAVLGEGGVEGVGETPSEEGTEIDADTVIGTESTASGSTVRADQSSTGGNKEQSKSPGLEPTQTVDDKFSGQEVTQDSAERVNEQDEYSEEGVKNKGEGYKEKEEEYGSGPSDTLGSREEHSGTYGGESGGSDDWQEGVELMPMIHDPELDQYLPSTGPHLRLAEIENILDTLQTTASDLPLHSDKVSKSLADVTLVLSTVDSHREEELNKRCGLVDRMWRELGERVRNRQAELEFEKAQLSVQAYVNGARDVLETQPYYLLLVRDVAVCLESLMDYFDPEQIESVKEQLLSDLDEALEHLKGVWPQGTEFEDCEGAVERLRQAYDALTDKVTQQKVFLEESLSLWSNFRTGCDQLSEWLDRAEDLVTKETYGYDVQETGEYLKTIKKLKDELPSREKQFSQIVEQGSEMLEKMATGEEPSQVVDQELSSFEQRWSDLVTQDSGAIDALESKVHKVVINWRAYIGMHEGTQSFIKQMTKMVGTEPLESSNGDHTLLTTYKTYQDQLLRLEVQYSRLVVIGDELSSNEKIGNRDGIRNEVSGLKLQWDPLKDNIDASLQSLISEYNDWIMMKLQKMAALVTQAEELVHQKVQFVESFPLSDLFEEDVTDLLKDADLLVASQEQLDQFENDCTAIEEDLLQRQIQQETTSSMTSSASCLERPATNLEKERLQTSREKLQIMSDALQPIINVFYLQLQLLQHIQDGKELVAKAMDFVGEPGDLEDMLAELEVRLSGDFFEKLSSEAYDLGAVAEDCEGTMEDIGEQEDFQLPAYQDISRVNRTLGNEVEILNASADEAKIRLQLFIQWWEEYRGNHDDLSPWLEGSEIRFSQLLARAESTQPPLVSPGELLLDVKELRSELEEKQVVLNALVSTSKNILEEMDTKGSPPGEIADQITDIQERFIALCEKVNVQLGEWEEKAGQFDSFLTFLTGFANWLNEFHSSLYDDVCIRIPPKASDETIARHRSKLEHYRQVVSSRSPDFDSLSTECERWGDYLVPDETDGNLPSPSEPSPPPFAEEDLSSQVPLPYIKKRVSSVSSKWSKVRQLILDREHQLEISSGNMQTFFETLQNLSDWINGKLKLDLLASPPPGSLGALNESLQELETLHSDLEKQVVMKSSLTQSLVTLKGELSSANVELVDTRMTKLDEMWGRLEAGKDERKKVCVSLIPRIETFWYSYNTLDEWVTERETTLQECGSIGANLARLIEQNDILKTLDEDLLEKKRDPEEILAESALLLKECLKGTGKEISEKSQNLEERFASLSQSSAERQELCEEALSAMQDFQKKVDSFTQWLEVVEKSLEDKKANKLPIGTVQLQLDEFYDFMRDIETHTEDYLSLCPEAKELSETYKPSDALDEMMSSLQQRWADYVEELSKRCDGLIGLTELWNRYEAEVKSLLDWVTDEANKFSMKVTTKGDEGIEDHIESCKVFTDTMTDKKKAIGDIEDLANILREEDGVKKNGTSDVDSRWTDVNQHWNSLCKLLAETMLRLESTYSEVRHVIQIRREEFDWLNDCEHMASEKVRTQGEIPVVEQEIETHNQLLAEIQNHQNECEFVERTIPFLVEHSRKANRETLKTEALDFCQRYHSLSASEDTYVHNLEESIPFWEEFKKQTRELAQWVDWASDELTSERMASGNASVTQTNLGNAQHLLQETLSRQVALNEAAATGDGLKSLVVAEDEQYIIDTLECLRDGRKEIEVGSSDRVNSLDERLTSWQVFPVEEARVVQEFLEEVSNAVDEEMEEEELTFEQLSEKLEQLESLQEAQQSNEDKVSTIELSVGSEDIKKALEKNPDISKERNNLLHGWSSVSDSLKLKISLMKQKATMVKEVEALFKKCEQSLKEYQRHIDTPLPPSVLLVTKQTDFKEKAVQLHNKCQSDLSSLQTSIQKYESSDNQSLSVPNHLKEKATSSNEQFHHLSTKAAEWTNQIEDIVSLWNKFHGYLGDLSSWCRSTRSEMSTLRVVENFASPIEFPSLEDRLQIITDELQERAPDFDFLVQTNPRHCTGDSPEVKKVKEKYIKLEKAWKSVTDEMKLFPELIGPWKELIDQFDELSRSLEGLGSRVERTFMVIEENDDADISDLIVSLKDHLQKISEHIPRLQEVHKLEDHLLTPQTCKKFKTVKELKTQCSKIETDIDRLRERVTRKLTELEEQERQWKVQATNSMQRLPLLEHTVATTRDEKAAISRQLQAAEEELEMKKAEITALQDRLLAIPLHVQPPRGSSKLSKLFFILFVLIFIVAILSFIVGQFGQIGPPPVRVM